MTRILVIANTLLARTGLTALLNTQQDLDVVGQVSDADIDSDAITADLNVFRPDVVVYDLGYEPMSVLSRLSELTEALLPLVVLLPDDEFLNATLSTLNEMTTPYGVLLRESDPDMLAAAINAVYTGLVTLEPSLAEAVIGTARDVPLPNLQTIEKLTPRESEVLQLLAEGLPNKSIAVTLGISPNTVKFHVNAILNKLDVQSRTEAVVRASQLGLIVL